MKTKIITALLLGGAMSLAGAGIAANATTPTYTLTAWQLGTGSTDSNPWVTPQTKVAQISVTDESLSQLDASPLLTCGHSYQIDLYTAPVVGNTLTGPSTPSAEHFPNDNAPHWKYIDKAACVPTKDACTATTIQNGFTLTHDAVLVSDGVQLSSEGTVHGGVIDKAVSFPLADANAIARNLTVDSGSGASFAIEMDTNTGATVTYEPAYSDLLWTDTAGILPRNNPAPNNNNGQGGPYSGNFSQLESNPTVTHLWVGIWNTTEVATLHSITLGCTTYTFGIPAVTPPPTSTVTPPTSTVTPPTSTVTPPAADGTVAPRVPAQVQTGDVSPLAPWYPVLAFLLVAGALVLVKVRMVRKH